MQLVKFKSEHIEDILKIENACFAIPWSRASLEKELSNKMAVYFVALEDDKVVGYGGMWHVITEGYITNIAVDKDYRRRHIADAIVKKLIEYAVEKEMIGVSLEVRVSNASAISLYKKNGFVLEGVRKEYYDDNKEDAYIMWKYLVDRAVLEKEGIV